MTSWFLGHRFLRVGNCQDLRLWHRTQVSGYWQQTWHLLLIFAVAEGQELVEANGS